MIHLQNNFLRVSLKPVGAELGSIILQETGREYIWQGDPAVWNGQAPLLFPIAGRLSSDSYIYDGAKYYLQKHGFARKCTFEVMCNDDVSASFRLCANEETLRVYPFDFQLDISYRIEKTTLYVSNKVTNNGSRKMYFSLGAHPGFNCKVGDFIRFSECETLETDIVDKSSIIIGKKPFIKNRRNIKITNDIFSDDALIFENIKSTAAEITTPEGHSFVRMEFGKVPFMLIWAKPGADFVCLEPWHGICDSIDSDGILEHKRGMTALEPGETFEFPYSITVR